MRKLILTMSIILLLPTGPGAFADEPFPAGEAILERVDQNMSAKSRIFTSRMVIHGRRASRTVTSRTWAEGETKAFTEYLAPARESGTKMLKLEDKLWMYSPDTDRIIQISGHMLRQSVMGSDLSYEDMMEDPELRHYYDAVVTGVEPVDGQMCWVIALTAKTEDIAYYRRTLWVDQKRDIPLQEELLARSGKLLKRMQLSDIVRIQDRWHPMRVFFKDMLQKGKGTEFYFESIQFDQEIPERYFSKAVLRR